MSLLKCQIKKGCFRGERTFILPGLLEKNDPRGSDYAGWAPYIFFQTKFGEPLKEEGEPPGEETIDGRVRVTIREIDSEYVQISFPSIHEFEQIRVKKISFLEF